MFCSNCGTKLEDGIMFCPNCGTKAESEAVPSPEDTGAAAAGADAVSGMEEPQAPPAAGFDAGAEMNAGGAGPETAAEPAIETSSSVAGAEIEMNPATETIGGGNTEWNTGMSADINKTTVQTAYPYENMQTKFCSNCGAVNKIDDVFCANCGRPMGSPAGSAGNGAPQGGMGNSQFNGAQPGGMGGGTQPQPDKPAGKKISKKVIGLLIGIAAVFMISVIAVAAKTLFMSPQTKVLRAVSSTMKDSPEILNDLKMIPELLSNNSYTIGVSAQREWDSINAEFRDAGNDRQISVSAEVDGENVDLLFGLHSGVLKASVSDLDYVFLYDPSRNNDGYISDVLRESDLRQLDELLESSGKNEISIKEFQSDLSAALLDECKELEFKDAKEKEFEIDNKDRKCKGYKVRINEKNIARFFENAGNRLAGRLSDDLADDFLDSLDDLIDEIKYEEIDIDITFYLYKSKLAAVILEWDDWGDQEFCIEFQGGDYRMQNMLLTCDVDGDSYDLASISTRKNGSKEVTEIESDYLDISITYDTKSGALSIESDDGWSDYLLEGTYKASGSEVSFTLEELEYGGYSLLEDEDISLTVYVKKSADIEKYKGTEFDLGSADEDDFEDLEDDLEEYAEMIEGAFY